MTWNTVYLDSGQTVPTTSNVSIQGTLNVESAASVRGTTTLHGALDSASNISGAALSATSGTFSGRVSIAAGAPIILVSASSTSIVATTCVANTSTTTSTTNNNVQQGDIILVGPSALSQGLVLKAYASANSTITWSYSNCSTANAAQTAINARYVALRFQA